MNNKFKILLALSLLILFRSITPNEQTISMQAQNLQFFTDIDGQDVLSSIDTITENKSIAKRSLSLKSVFKLGKRQPLEVPLNQINSANPQLATLWNNTGMIFGAVAGGVGIGTTFAIKKLDNGRMVFLTNFHVVEQFCQIPEGVNSDLVETSNLKYPCESLFVLHDVSINTQTNSADIDGTHPWKSEVPSLDYFDKQRDIAAFTVDLPEDNEINPVVFESNYDLKNLLIARKNAEKIDPKLPPITVNGIEMSPLSAFPLYLVAYSLPKESVSIKKQWFKGSVEGIRTYENEKKLGFISALKHNIEVLPGSSGAPLALSDGRIIGINTSIELKKFYSRNGWLWWKKYKLETYNSYFAMPAIFVKDFIEKII